jgi:aminoglycoside phosphotransferase (APT) family kinase protein
VTDGEKNERSMESLGLALAAAGVDLEQVTGCCALAGGEFNAVSLLTLVTGERLVVKIPPAGIPLLSYERGMLGTEALFYRLAGSLPGVTVPVVLAVDPGDAGGGHLVMTECPGKPWQDVEPPLSTREREGMRAELGRQVARLHTVAGVGFGYPSGALGPLRESWSAAFLGMVDAVLADAARFAVALPLPAAEVRQLFAAHAGLLDEVTVPVLTHFDLWEGNILVSTGPDGREVGALIDAERAFWGDPLADLVTLGLYHDIETDAAFLRGYRSEGGRVAFSPAERERIALYSAYLQLILWVEAVPRGPADDERLAWLHRFALDPLTASLARWAGGETARTIVRHR